MTLADKIEQADAPCRDLDISMLSAEQERRIVEWLREESKSSWCLSDRFPWWKLKLRFANKVAAATMLNLSNAIERGEHRKAKP